MQKIGRAKITTPRLEKLLMIIERKLLLNVNIDLIVNGKEWLHGVEREDSFLKTRVLLPQLSLSLGPLFSPPPPAIVTCHFVF